MSLFEETHYDPFTRDMPCESDSPWQDPEPRYRQSLLHPQIQPFREIKIWVTPTEIYDGWVTLSGPEEHILVVDSPISDQTFHSTHKIAFNSLLYLPACTALKNSHNVKAHTSYQ